MLTPDSTKQTQLRWLVQAIAHPTDKCILWPFRMVDDDHALVRYKSRKQIAHRVAYRLHYGRYPKPQGIRQCGELRCINPLHVKPGGTFDNGAFRAAKRKTRYEWLRREVASRPRTVECWDWPFARDMNGYGKLLVPIAEAGRHKIALAHRCAFYFCYGRWPVGEGRHKCDRPCCFSPYHIVEGSHLDNMREMVAKGRNKYAVGEGCSFHKLTERDVQQMRRLYDSEEATVTQIAGQFGVGWTCARGVVTRRTWKHI